MFAFYCASKMNQQQANLTSFVDGCKAEPELTKQIANQTYTCKPADDPPPVPASDE